MTNGDRIRNMTDEELADFLTLTSEDAEDMILNLSQVILAARIRKNLENLLGKCPTDALCLNDLLIGEVKQWLSSETTECKN